MPQHRFPGFAIAAILILTSIPARAGFFISDMGVLPGGSFSQGNGINQSGTIVGVATLSVTQNRAVKGGTTAPIDLGTLDGGRTSTGWGINNFGLATGDSEVLINGTFRVHAFRSQGNGALRDMGVLGTDVSSAGRAINSAGHIAGFSTSAGGRTQAFIGFAPDALTPVGNLGGINSAAYAINDSDVVAGEAQTATGFTHAFISQGGQTTDLGTLPGSTGSAARGINSHNDVVGFTTGPVAHAFLALGSGGPLIDLGVGSGSSSTAYAINDSRQIVGTIDLGGGDSTGFLWVPDNGGSLYDLNSLIFQTSGWRILSATGINNNAQITGLGIYNGELHGFRLDPIPGQNITDPPNLVPEPSTAVLLAAGAVTIALARGIQSRRRSRRETPAS